MNNKLFTIFFMILVTAFFIAILSTVNEISKGKIQEKEQIHVWMTRVILHKHWRTYETFRINNH